MRITKEARCAKNAREYIGNRPRLVEGKIYTLIFRQQPERSVEPLRHPSAPGPLSSGPGFLFSICIFLAFCGVFSSMQRECQNSSAKGLTGRHARDIMNI